MEGEPDPATASLELALFWRKVYREILTMEEAVLARIRALMADQSSEARREVELTNVPVVVGPRAGAAAGTRAHRRNRCCGCCDRSRSLRSKRSPRFRGFGGSNPKEASGG